jgi:transcriptional regulator with XRE-family HTH domain
MDKSINKRVRIYRKRAGLTQNELAERLGMKGSTYSQMEREGNIPANRLLQIADVLGIEPSILFEGEKVIVPEVEVPVIKIAEPEPIFVPQPDPLEILSHKERNILKIFRFLPQEKKNKLYKYIMELEKE